MTDEKRQLERYLKNGNVEIRCIDKTSPQSMKAGKPLIWSSVFDDYDLMVKEIKLAEKKGYEIYQTVNPVLIPATNSRLRPYQRTTRDADIEQIRSIFFDFDAIRETGSAATPEQVTACEVVAVDMSEFLDAEHGWGVPTVGWSGNGVHLYYQTALSCDDAKEYLRGLYAGLEKRFNTDTVSFDVSVKNPSRISRCLGTINQKAGRRSSVIVSDEFVMPKLVIDAAKKLTPPKPKPTWVKPVGDAPAGRYIKNWDIAGEFNRRGMYLEQTHEAMKHFVTCPWHESHSETGPTDSVIWEGEWPNFHCSHAHCSERGIKDVIALFTNR